MKKSHGVIVLVSLLLAVSETHSHIAKGWHLVTSARGSHGPYIIDLQFVDLNKGWALIPSGLLETKDGGRSWERRLRSGIPENVFSSFVFSNKTNGWVVGACKESGKDRPLIINTKDGGETWQPQTVDLNAHLSGVEAHGLWGVRFYNQEKGWAVGEGLIIHTKNAGITWEIQRLTDSQEVLISLDNLNAERLWAVGMGGLILHTNDGGKTWIRQKSKTTNALMQVRFFNDEGWIVGSGGTILHSVDGGVTWEHQEIGIREDLRDIHISGSQGWIVGRSGTILYTGDHGKTWRRQKSPTINNLTCLFSLDSGNVWAGGENLTIVRYSD